MYEPSPLLYYKPLFMFELIFAELIFAVRLERRKGFWLRALLMGLFCFGGAMALPILSYSAFYVGVLFLTMFLFTFVAGFVLFRASFKSILLCLLLGFTVQHTAHELYELFGIMGNLNGLSSDFYGAAFELHLGSGVTSIGALDVFKYTVYLGIYILTYFLAAFVSYFNKHEVRAEHVGTFTVCILTGFVLVIDVFFGAAIIYSMPGAPAGNALGMLHIYNICCCLVAFALLLELPKRKSAEYDLLVVSKLHREEREMYGASREVINLLNIKAHDLKHQLAAGGLVREEAREIAEVVEDYDSLYNTQNEALNVILTEKSIVCRRYGILLSVIADGAGLGFMVDGDVYALFGNLLDNAIEAVKDFDGGAKTIGLTVRTRGEMVSVNVYNAYSGDVLFKDGLPQTKKRDVRHHGFGMKSIRYIVEKYHGQLRIKAEDGIFDLAILFWRKD